jgi:hypothetical protein
MFNSLFLAWFLSNIVVAALYINEYEYITGNAEG